MVAFNQSLRLVVIDALGSIELVTLQRRDEALAARALRDARTRIAME
jgi:hypothetical protein